MRAGARYVQYLIEIMSLGKLRALISTDSGDIRTHSCIYIVHSQMKALLFFINSMRVRPPLVPFIQQGLKGKIQIKQHIHNMAYTMHVFMDFVFLSLICWAILFSEPEQPDFSVTCTTLRARRIAKGSKFCVQSIPETPRSVGFSRAIICSQL